MSNYKDPKNVIFILSDDQGYWSLGCYGNDEVISNNIDALANDGIRFDNFFCASPVCSPARATLLTGKIPSQHGVHDWIEGGTEERRDIEYLEGQSSFINVLKDNGYTCGLSGKWHLGNSAEVQMGFDHWFAHQGGSSEYYAAPMYRDGELYIENNYITDVITDDAIDFITQNKDKPFYAQVAYTAPHSPWIRNHPKEIEALYDDCEFNSVPSLKNTGVHKDSIYLSHEVARNERANLVGYFAAVTAMDQNIGRIVKTLDELGIRDETLIVFTSDNGFSTGHHGLWGKGNATYPFNFYDESIKVPFILNYSGFTGGQVNEDLISAYDLRQSLIDILELEDNTDNSNLVGRSFKNNILKYSEDSNDAVFVMDEYGPNRVMRTKSDKLIIRYPDGPNEYYDLLNDPAEQNNLIDNSEYQERISSMSSELNNWYEEHVDPRVDGSKLNVYGTGQKAKVDLNIGEDDSFIMDPYIKDTAFYKANNPESTEVN